MNRMSNWLTTMQNHRKHKIDKISLEVRLTTAEGKIVVLRKRCLISLLDEVIDIQAHLVTVDKDWMA